jgi:hypothetical protein
LVQENHFTRLFDARASVQVDTRSFVDHAAELSRKDVAACWSHLLDEFLNGDLRPEQQDKTSSQKRSIFNTVMKKRYGSKHFVLAVLQTGSGWLGEHAQESQQKVLVHCLLRWIHRVQAAVQTYETSLSYLNARQRGGSQKYKSGLTDEQWYARRDLKVAKEDVQKGQALLQEALAAEQGKYSKERGLPRHEAAMSNSEQWILYDLRNGILAQRIQKCIRAHGGADARPDDFRV